MDGKKQELMKKCIDYTKQAEKILECPVCFETNKALVQCANGHFICVNCQTQVESCPQCRGSFSGLRKCYGLEELSKVLNNLQISQDDLEKEVKRPDQKIEEYRKVIRSLLNHLTDFLRHSSSSLTTFGKYMGNPNSKDHAEVERQMISWTSKMQVLQRFMNNTEYSLKTLKK